MPVPIPVDAWSVLKTLRADIVSGRYPPGQKLPSEARLIETFAVKRHVVRKAIDLLRHEGLVVSHQGAGVFVSGPPETAPADLGAETVDLSLVLELSEFRLAVETEAAALAAIRRSPAQEEEIFYRHRMFGELMQAGQPTFKADLALHKAIAHATNNRRFSDFIEASGSIMVPHMTLDPVEAIVAKNPQRLVEIHREHAEIVTAIGASDADGAGQAMRAHLQNSLHRYRTVLTSARN